MGNKLLRPTAFILIGGTFGLALARVILDTWPLLVGPLPRWPLAVISTLAFTVAGYRLSRTPSEAPPSDSGVGTRSVLHSLIPLLLPAATLLSPAPDPMRDWILIAGAICGFAITLAYHFSPSPLPPVPLSRLYPLSLGFITSALYLRTLAPTVGEADTFEFQVNVVKLGVSHGSGYPLYILLAKLFSLLPFGGTVAWRINLSAAFFGVTATLVCYSLARALRASRPAAWIAAFSLATSIGLWSRAVEAEVYTLHVTLVGALLYLSVKTLESRDRLLVIGYWKLDASRGTLRVGFWDLGFFLFGLSLANHLTTALLAPALLVALAANTSRLRPRSGDFGLHSRSNWGSEFRFWGLKFGVWSLLCLLGLSIYLYLPIRWPAVNQGETMTWDMFLRFFTGAEAQGALRLNAWYSDFSRYAIVGRKALEQFGWIGIITAGIGLVALFRKRPAAALVTLATYAAYAFFGLSFYVPDPDYSSFLLPAHLVQAVWMAYGVSRTLALPRPALRASGVAGAGSARVAYLVSRIPLRNTLYALFFLLPAGLIPVNFAKVDQSDDWREYWLGQYILSQPLKENAAILADSELIAPLYYLQTAEGLRPDLDIIVLPAEAYYRAELDARVANGQTVYLGRYLPHLADAYHLNSVGPLVEVQFPPALIQAVTRSHIDQFGDSIRLKDFQLDSTVVANDESLRLTLFWQAIESPPANYLVVLRLVDAGGAPRLTGPAEVPVGQMYPTAAWLRTMTIADFHNFALDPSLEPGQYDLQVGLFPPFSQEGLKLESGGQWLTLTEVTLTEPITQPIIQRPVRMRFNDVWLLGYDAPEIAAPGSQLTVTLYLQSDHTEAAVVCAGEKCAPVQVRAASGITVERVALPVPNQSQTIRLSLGVPADFAECGWWPAPPVKFCDLANISVKGAVLDPNAVNFDQKIVLVEIEIETSPARPGETVIVNAEWRGLQPMGEDYTVFVHLLGPDGLVHGQVDTWPVQGTLPTTQWPVNEPITDRFEVRVPDDAPPGDYQVEVGWYLLATLDRLPVVTGEGVAVDDKYVIEGLVIGN